MVSVLNALLLIHELTGNDFRQFLFQSATPNPLLLGYLERAGLRTQVIRGHYRHDNGLPDTDEWRRILHGSTITFNASTVGTVEKWLDQHLEETLLPFLSEIAQALRAHWLESILRLLSGRIRAGWQSSDGDIRVLPICKEWVWISRNEPLNPLYSSI